MMTTPEALKRVCALARRHLNEDRVRTARRRQAAMFANQEADYIPLTFGGNVPELKELPEYDWREQWYDPAKSLLMQMKGVVANAAGGSDYAPGVRPDMGVINGPSLFGVEYVVPTHTKPVVSKYVPKEALAAFRLPEDIRALGTVPRIIEHIEHHLKVLKAEGLSGMVSVYHCDTQGPFDIAEQTRGHDFFTDPYEDPDFVHHLMEQATQAYIRLAVLCKRMSGEGEKRGMASGYWMDKGGVRMCDDSGILLSPKIYREFVLPYQAKGLAQFGGGWLHYCGGVPEGGRREGLHLHDLYLSMPDLRGLNFTTGMDLMAEVRKVVAHGVAYVGGLRRAADESQEAYYRRALSLCPGRKGMILGGGPRTPDESAQAMNLWHKLQDEVFPR